MTLKIYIKNMVIMTPHYADISATYINQLINLDIIDELSGLLHLVLVFGKSSRALITANSIKLQR